MLRMLRAVVRAVSGGILLLAVGGCSGWSWSNPFAFDRPPAGGHVENASYRPAPDRTILLIEHFEGPPAGAVPLTGVGTALSEALRRALLQEAAFEVWIESEPIAGGAGHGAVPDGQKNEKRKKIATAATGPADEDDPPGDPRYVVTGRVTDFHHTGELARDVRRWGLFGKKKEAIVAVNLTVTDTRTNRIVATDHVKGTASAGWAPSAEVYAGIEMGSYLFWSTPLGRASNKAIDEAADRIIAVVPEP
jgi:hypothetical protein